MPRSKSLKAKKQHHRISAVEGGANFRSRGKKQVSRGKWTKCRSSAMRTVTTTGGRSRSVCVCVGPLRITWSLFQDFKISSDEKVTQAHNQKKHNRSPLPFQAISHLDAGSLCVLADGVLVPIVFDCCRFNSCRLTHPIRQTQ